MKIGDVVYPTVTAVSRSHHPLDKTPYMIVRDLGAMGYMVKDLTTGSYTNAFPEDFADTVFISPEAKARCAAAAERERNDRVVSQEVDL